MQFNFELKGKNSAGLPTLAACCCPKYFRPSFSHPLLRPHMDGQRKRRKWDVTADGSVPAATLPATLPAAMTAAALPQPGQPLAAEFIERAKLAAMGVASRISQVQRVFSFS